VSLAGGARDWRGTMVSGQPACWAEAPERNKRLVGSLIGGILETQEMLDYCGERRITPDIGIIPIQKINEAYERMLANDVKYRFVIDEPLALLKRDEPNIFFPPLAVMHPP
jgi:D-arabinose 1-dehydrogenase-like Zn-dependent alcohol dehydrogenase